MTKYLVLALFAACFLAMGAFAFAADKDDRAPVPTIVHKGVCVYERPNFQGRMQCWAADTDITNLDPSWGDRIASVRIFGDGKLLAYTGPNFQGERIVIYSDVADLAELPLGTCFRWNDQISSLQVQ